MELGGSAGPCRFDLLSLLYRRIHSANLRESGGKEEFWYLSDNNLNEKQWAWEIERVAVQFALSCDSFAMFCISFRVPTASMFYSELDVSGISSFMFHLSWRFFELILQSPAVSVEVRSNFDISSAHRTNNHGSLADGTQNSVYNPPAIFR